MREIKYSYRKSSYKYFIEVVVIVDRKILYRSSRNRQILQKLWINIFLIPALKSWQELQIDNYLCDVTPACEDN